MQIITPKLKKKLELKEWITGGDFEEINKPITDVKFEVGSSGAGKAEINAGEAQRKSIEKAIEIIVVSVDGDEKDILKKIYALPVTDYQFVLSQVNRVKTGEDFTKAE
jgi:hypothetical protein